MGKHPSDQAMPASTDPPVPLPRPTAGTAFWRALRLRCPACGGGPVFLRWLRVCPVCPSCGIRFDDQGDREDHVFWLHGHGAPTMRATEPPPGHPDWIS